MRRIIGIIILLVFLLLMISYKAEASPETHYINQLPYTITEPGIYILNMDGNITEDVAITIKTSNVILDGKNHVIKSEGISHATGIYAKDVGNLTIKNIKISGFHHGILLNSSDNSVIYNSTILNNDYGITLYYSSNNNISNNNISNNEYYGVDLLYSSNNTICNNILSNNHYQGGVGLMYSSNNNIIYNNTISNNYDGIYITSSSNSNIIYNNTISNNHYFGIDLGYSSSNNIYNNTISNNHYYGIVLCCSSNNLVRNNSFYNDSLVVDGPHNTIVDNLVNDKPLVYLEDVSNYVISGKAGQVILVNCNNITISNLTLSNIAIGIDLIETNNTRITDNTLSNNYILGIFLYNSSSNIIYNNTISNNDCGITLWSSPSNNIYNNTISNNHYYGIFLRFSSNKNIIYNNTILNNEYGIVLSCSLNNNIYNNIVSDNNRGVGIGGLSSNNTIYDNIILNNDYGIIIHDSSNNNFYHNNFINNSKQVYSSNSVNIWDDGYPSGGNYWSDYNGVDSNNDGIGDTPYVIDENNIDHYPLMQPVSIFKRERPGIDINPVFQSGSSGLTINYTISVRNNDPSIFGSSTFKLYYSVPLGWSASLSKSYVTIEPGETVSLTLSVTSPLDAKPGNYTIFVSVVNMNDTRYNTTCEAVYNIPSTSKVNYPITKPTPWYQQYWFIITIILIVLIALAYIWHKHKNI